METEIQNLAKLGKLNVEVFNQSSGDSFGFSVAEHHVVPTALLTF